MNQVIIVEDDVYLREELIHTFIKKGYPATGISSFDAPEQEILDRKPGLVVLDLNLPGKSGFALCRWLKARASFPILILTACDTLPDELRALELGADDFLTKPCHPDRLLAHAARLLRTYGEMRGLIKAEGLALDPDTYKVIWKDKYVVLSETEGKLLRVLMEHYPSVVSGQAISLALWGGENFVDENILPVNMTRLRKSLDTIGLRDFIQTVRGKGYRLSPEVKQ